MRYLPSSRYFPFELVIPDHLSARGLVRSAVGVWEVELDEPVVVDGLRQSLQFRDFPTVQFYLFVETSENARYMEIELLFHLGF